MLRQEVLGLSRGLDFPPAPLDERLIAALHSAVLRVPALARNGLTAAVTL